MNVAILGTWQPSQIVAEIIEQHYNLWIEKRLGEKLNIVAYVTGGGVSTPNIENIPVLNPVQFALLYHKKVIDKIIFPREVYMHQRTLMTDLLSLNLKLEDIYLNARLHDSINVPFFIEPYISAKFLPYLEYHIADHCNLNCHGCGHCSSLVRKPIFPVLEKFARDFQQLKKFIDDIGVIRIMGGEPLLNPEINEYFKLTRELYPLSNIRVVTNAILLPKMPENFFNALLNYDINVDISVYPPMKSKIPAIQNLLHKKGVKSAIGMFPKDEFSKRKVLHPHSHPRETFFQCGSAMCNFLYDGKIAPCCAPFMSKYFNEYFNQNLPTDGTLNLYDKSNTSEKIIKYLFTPLNSCRYCGKSQNFKWKIINHPVKLSDWVTDVADS